MSAHEIAAAVLATVAGVAAVVVDYFSADPTDGTPAVAALAGAITIGFAVLLFAGAVPRAKADARGGGAAARTALVTSIVGFFSVASAWTGLPFVLGTGGAMLGNAARRDAAQPQRGIAAFAIALGICAIGLGIVTVTVS
jgi:hypothetical protein